MASAETAHPPAAFGNSRGSGLARGKRPAAPAAAPAPASTGEYHPTAIEIVATKSEYQNPFAESASAAPVKEEAKPAAAASAPASVEIRPIPPAAPAPAPVEAEIKPQLNILPPQESKRSSLSWEHTDPAVKTDARPRRDDRPIFRPERREQRPFEAREPRPFEGREPRESRRDASPAPRDFQRAPVENAPKKSGGVFGWLKDLFGGQKPSETNGHADHERSHDEHRGRRRRRRGGRGRGGFSEGGAPHGEGQSRREGEPMGEHRHDGGGGHRRRRHRGGRGRNFRHGGEGGRGGPPAS